MKLAAIVALSEDGTIGRQGKLPWHLPDDLRRFREITWGHTIIMGRKTYESIGRPLPGRTTLVLTRQEGYRPPGVEACDSRLRVVRSLDEALASCAGAVEVFVVGGESLFREALPRCERLYVTLVHARIAGDVHFPLAALDRWRLLREEPHAADARHEHAFTFRVYERIPDGKREKGEE